MSFAQEKLGKQVEGNVSYITIENVYCDLGSEQGVGLGDTLKVLRRNDEIGLLVVQSTGRKSSVTIPLVSANLFQLGDRVLFTAKEKKTVSENIIEEKKIEEPIKKKKRTKPLFDQGGSVSLRGNWNEYSGGSQHQRLLGNLNYRLGMDLPLKTQVWIYGHNNFMENTFRLYQMRLEFGDKNDRFFGQVGRLYSSELAGIGAVDGAMVSVGGNRRSRVGVLAGYQPSFLKTELSTDVSKIGVFSTNEWKSKKQIIRFNTALVGQYTKNEIDREFLYLRFYWKTKSNFEFSWYETIDMYRNTTIYDRSQIEPISSQISFRYRLGKILTLNSRLSSRRQIVYQQSGTLITDSLFVDELRSGWYNAIQIRTEDWGTLRISSNHRVQANSSDLSQVYSGGYTTPRFRNNIYVRFSSSYIKNMLITGLRNRISLSKSFKGKGSLYTEYDIYVYGFGNQFTDYVRHTLSFGINFRLMKRMSTNCSVDLSNDGEFSSVYVYFGINYRL